jgi:GT2 family glycosyltransferase
MSPVSIALVSTVMLIGDRHNSGTQLRTRQEGSVDETCHAPRERMLKDTCNSSICPLVSVVIVNYNSGPDLAACLRSVADSTYPRKELIIVDNASEDDSIMQVRALYPDAEIVRNRVNLGYSGAGNIGLAKSRGEFVVLLNPDTVVDKCWLEGLVDAAARYPRAAFFQPKILLMDDRRVLNSAGNMIHVAGFGICRGIGTLDEGVFDKEVEVCYASGACTLARREALRQIGPLDRLFFAYGEDKDWGWRGLMMGWQSMYIPSSTILHKWSPVLGHSGSKFYLLEFERVLSIWKNYSNRTLLILAPLLFLVELSVLLHATFKGWLAEKLRTYSDLFRMRKAVTSGRRMMQARRVIQDGVVLGNFVAEIEHPYVGVLGLILNRLVLWIFARLKASL